MVLKNHPSASPKTLASRRDPFPRHKKIWLSIVEGLHKNCSREVHGDAVVSKPTMTSQAGAP